MVVRTSFSNRERFANFASLLFIFVALLSAVRVEAQLSPQRAVAPSVATMMLFQNEQQAQTHCPQDKVVWLNLASGVYHFKGQRWYANTNRGAFVCEKEADETGEHPTANGQ